MHRYAEESGIALTEVCISNFRSLANVGMDLGDLAALVGSNNARNTSFIDALFAAVASGRKALGQLLSSVAAKGGSSKYIFKEGNVLFGLLRAYLRKYWRATFETAIATVLSDVDADLATLEFRLRKACALKQGMKQELLIGRTRLLASEGTPP